MKEGSRRRLTWLVLCCALTFAVIVLGGVVRLLRAGLSITEWDPVTGILPPLGELGWRDAFDRYRATPEFAEFNSTIGLPEFREIYLLEYAHRLLARLTGLAVALPLAYGLARREISRREARPILAVFVAGGLQAGLGWLMVKSGLTDVPHVSPYRLTAHLVVGTALFATIVWMIAGERPRQGTRGASTGAVRLGALTLAAALVTFVWGGLMAGTHAGHVFPTFPTMGGAWLPVDLASLPRTCATDPAAIHFVHRFVAVVFSVACSAFAWSARRVSAHAHLLATLTFAALLVQLTLGAFVVLLHVPVVLASLHQANAVLLVGLLTATVHEASRPGDPSATPDGTS
jgi:cytochrome c oxidase assembly protein subunit 15